MKPKKPNPGESLAELNPKRAEQWHPAKNGNLSPYGVSAYSNIKVWWKCPKGDDHEWQSIVLNRSKGRGCPICSSRKVVNSNCLATVNPALAKEWHPTKNLQLTPSQVTSGSRRKVWWLCKSEHEWIDTISHRTYGRGCHVCNKEKAAKNLVS